MSIVACNECGGQVSTDANACPHCGSPTHYVAKVESTWLGDTFGWLLLGGAFLLGWYVLPLVFDSPPKQASAPNQTSATQQILAPPNPILAPPNPRPVARPPLARVGQDVYVKQYDYSVTTDLFFPARITVVGQNKIRVIFIGYENRGYRDVPFTIVSAVWPPVPIVKPPQKKVTFGLFKALFLKKDKNVLHFWGKPDDVETRTYEDLWVYDDGHGIYEKITGKASGAMVYINKKGIITQIESY